MRDLTEGIDLSKTDWPFLKRNMPPMLRSEEEYNRLYTPQENKDHLTIRISPNNYHIQYDPFTEDYFLHAPIVQKRGLVAAQGIVKQKRKTLFREKFSMNDKWTADLAQDEVDNINSDFSLWIKGDAASKSHQSDPKAMQDAEVMDL